MRAAREHASKVEPLLTADPIFAEVKALEYTGAGGSLLLQGHITDQGEFDRLRSLVASTRPQVTVVYELTSRDKMDAFHEVVPHK
jgi:hypothetical protein